MPGRNSHVLVLNTGSSTIKFKIFENTNGTVKPIAKGSASKLGSGSAPVNVSILTEQPPRNIDDTLSGETTHDAAIKKIIDVLTHQTKVMEGIDSVGHRVVHGGQKFWDPIRITPESLEDLDALSDLAPLHNHPSVVVIRASLDLLPNAVHSAVFDTSFHKTLPEKVYTYALPYDASKEAGLRRYGFHGTSHAYVARQAAKAMGGDLESYKIISLHLGNGASACAIDHGKSIDTSMGFTPVEGLVMGTRSGDIDPSAIFHISSNKFNIEGKTPAIPSAPKGPQITKAEAILNQEGGLRGLCGESDIRKVEELANGKIDGGSEEERKEKQRRAQLALDVYCYRIQKYVGSYFVALSGADAIIFTGGVGENSVEVRRRVAEKLGCLGAALDAKANEAAKGGDKVQEISTKGSKLRLFIVPTDEEGEIAKIALSIQQQK
ncbi:hypothetical protein HDV00_002614 [Rhizophlyctis rosea]|nr:hypothetical protein HDV00_002614 [Rhizophlyctis rosea]